MRRSVAFLALLALAAGVLAARAEARPGLVTVELFTSQGCSSCPPADQLLGELAQRDDVLALTLAVDYWDYLGWRDTLARPEHTKRQYAYAKALRTYRPYTPQIVIDGRLDIVGNNKSKVRWAIEDRLKRRPEPVVIRCERDADSVAILIGAGKPVEATVWLVRYLDHVTVKIDRGENEGRTITYANVVQSLTPIGMWKGEPARFVLPRRDLLGTNGAERHAVIVQTENAGPVLGAAKLPVK